MPTRAYTIDNVSDPANPYHFEYDYRARTIQVMERNDIYDPTYYPSGHLFVPGATGYDAQFKQALTKVPNIVNQGKAVMKSNRGDLLRYAPTFAASGQPVMGSPVADSTDDVFGEAVLS